MKEECEIEIEDVSQEFDYGFCIWNWCAFLLFVWWIVLFFIMIWMVGHSKH